MISGAPRSSVTVAILMPGVTTGGGGNAYNSRTNGGIITGDEAVVDGATASEGFMNQSGMVSLQTDFGMSPDITSEVKILASNYDAQYGNSTSGQLIVQTRSGGEKFHGAAYEYLRNDALNAKQYGASNKDGRQGKRLRGQRWRPDLDSGISSPDAYVKGYFYFNWEGFQDHGGASSSTLSIASLAARAGNFSGVGSQLYYPADPAKYGALAGTAIPNNQIDPQFEDPIAKAFHGGIADPYQWPGSQQLLHPQVGPGIVNQQRERVFLSHRHQRRPERSLLLHLLVAVQRCQRAERSAHRPLDCKSGKPGECADPAPQLGAHPLQPDDQSRHRRLPEPQRRLLRAERQGQFAHSAGSSQLHLSARNDISAAATRNWATTRPPDATDNLTTRGTWAVNDVFTRIQGKHTLSFGLEYKLAGMSIHSGGNQGGTFNFAADTTGNTGCANSSLPRRVRLPAFTSALPCSANVEYINVLAKYPRQTGWAFHGGDSWRLTPKLNLSYSLRWDYITPFVDKKNNLSFIDPIGGNPDAVTASGAELPGRLAFAGTKFGAASYGARYPEIPFKKGWGPRVGFAYTLNDKTVVRAGYGIYFGQAFYPGWGGGLAQDGFNKNLTLNESSVGNFKTPAIYLVTGISPSQVGPTQNINSGFDNGQTPSLYRPLDGNRRPYSSQWQMTVERQLPSNTTLTLSYVGTKGTHLPSALSPINVLNPLNPTITAIGSDLAVNYNDPTGPATFAAHGVAQPYVGWASQMTGCAPTIAQALQPFPQYCGNLLGLNEQHGNSIYRSFQGRGKPALSRWLLPPRLLDAAEAVHQCLEQRSIRKQYRRGRRRQQRRFQSLRSIARARDRSGQCPLYRLALRPFMSCRSGEASDTSTLPGCSIP